MKSTIRAAGSSVLDGQTTSGRRRETNQTLESHRAAHHADQEELPSERCNVPAGAKAGSTSLGLRQPEDMTVCSLRQHRHQ